MCKETFSCTKQEAFAPILRSAEKHRCGKKETIILRPCSTCYNRISYPGNDEASTSISRLSFPRRCADLLSHRHCYRENSVGRFDKSHPFATRSANSSCFFVPPSL